MKNRKLLTLLIMAPFFAYSQCDCSKALDKDLKDKYTDLNSEKLRAEIFNFYNSEETIRKQKISSANYGSFLESISNYGFYKGGSSVGLSKDKQFYNEIKRQMVEDSHISQDNFELVVTDIFSDNQLEAYKYCLKYDCKKEGAYYTIGNHANKIFSVKLAFDSSSGGKQITLRGDAISIKCEPIGDFVFTKDAQIGKDQSLIQFFERNDMDEPAMIALNFVEDLDALQINVGEEKEENEPLLKTITENIEFETRHLSIKHSVAVIKNGDDWLLDVVFKNHHGDKYPIGLEGQEYRILNCNLKAENPSFPFDDTNIPRTTHHKWSNYGDNPFNLKISDDKQFVSFNTNKPGGFFRLKFLSKFQPDLPIYTFDNKTEINVKDGFKFRIVGIAEIKREECIANCD